MPTFNKLDWVSAGRIGRKVDAVGDGAASEAPVPAAAVKKEVIWRCAGSLAAPANWRLARGADMASMVLSCSCGSEKKFCNRSAPRVVFLRGTATHTTASRPGLLMLDVARVCGNVLSVLGN